MHASIGFVRVFLVVTVLLARPALALEEKNEIRLSGELNMLVADLAIIGYDPENAAYFEQAGERLKVIRSLMPGWMDAQPEEQRSQAALEWDAALEILEGTPGYPGVVEGYYSINSDSSQRIHVNALQGIILASPSLQDEALSDLETLYLRVTSVVAGYVVITSSPFGAVSVSVNDDDSKVVTLTAEIDGLFKEVINSSSSPLEKRTLRRLQAKWQFIRGTVMQGSQTGMPYIVRFQGNQIASDLALMIGE